MSSLSFCIVAAGSRNELLDLALASIHAQQVPGYEILVVGRFREGPGHRYVEAKRDADAGRVARLRNLALDECRGDRAVILDDDVLLTPGWYRALCRLPEDSEAVVGQVRLPDGGRYWDRAMSTRGGVQLREHHEKGTWVGPFGGGGHVVHRRLFERVRFDERIGLGEFEALEWSGRARHSGATFTHSASCVVYHADPGPTTVGRQVFARAQGRGASWVRKELDGVGARALLVQTQEQLDAGRVAEAADCLRFGLEREPKMREYSAALHELESAFGGRLSDVRWSSDGDPLYRSLVEQCRSHAAPSLVPLRPRAAQAAGASTTPRPHAASRPEERLGVNLFGFISANLGLGVAARHQLRLLLESDFDVWAVDVPVGGGRSLHDMRYAELTHDLLRPAPHAINIFALNPSDLGNLARCNAPAVKLDGHINICIPFWELPRIPPSWVETLESMDFVIASSQFIEYALLASIGRARVLHIPQPLYIDESPQPDRRAFGIPEGHVAFVSSFEVSSDLNRKNPFAVLEAFRLAFTAEQNVTLVIKINNSQAPGCEGPHLQHLRKLAANDPRVQLIDRTLSYRDVLSLYASGDVYVSLHRAEGLGLGLMEAMSLGKPVIATAWSGNMGYMNERTACLVGYELIPVQAANQPAYQPSFTGPGAQWADPRIDEAAAWMRRLASEAQLRQRIGKAAAESMRIRAASASADELLAAIRNLVALRAAARG